MQVTSVLALLSWPLTQTDAIIVDAGSSGSRVYAYRWRTVVGDAIANVLPVAVPQYTHDNCLGGAHCKVGGGTYMGPGRVNVAHPDFLASHNISLVLDPG